MNPLEKLLSSLAGVPILPGARCRGRHHLFDAQVADEDPTERHRQAIGLCQRCPAIDGCRQWVDSLPAGRRPPGVVAGQRYSSNGRNLLGPLQDAS